jgi:hypothetical protein
MMKISQRAMFAALALALSVGAAQAAHGHDKAHAGPAAYGTAETAKGGEATRPHKRQFRAEGQEHRKGKRPGPDVMFERMDLDGDGVISREEFDAAVAKRAEMRGTRGH